MPDTDNVVLDKITLDTTDFGEGLGNSFGIENTQTLASNELSAFLSGADPTKITKVEKIEKVEDTTKPDNTTNSTDTTVKTDLQKATEEAQKGKDALENVLFKQDDKEDTDNQSSQSNKADSSQNQSNQAGKDSESDNDTFSTLAKDLLRLGVFQPNTDDETEDTIEVKSPEEFLDRVRSEQKKGAVSILENFLGQFGDDYRKAFDAIFVNGIDPKEYLTSFTRIESVKDLDMADEGNQKRVLRDYYKSLKMDDSKIESKLEKLKDYGELEDEAKTYHQVLLDKEIESQSNLLKKTEESNAAKRASEQQITQSYQRILEDKLRVKEIDGIPLNQKEAQDIFGYLVNKPYKLESGELLSEFDKDILELNKPENHEQKIKLALLLKKKLDLSAVKKTAVSKKTDELFTLSTRNAKKADATTKTTGSFFS